MALALPVSQQASPDLPATARLRAGILVVASSESLVDLFADALAEHGIHGHFLVAESGGGLTPILGDTPELIGNVDVWIVEAVGARVLLSQPDGPLTGAELARVRGYAALYAARAIALQEIADDVETGCGLTLRERYVLGRRLAGLAPVDIACEAELSVETVSRTLDQAAARLGAANVASAIALAARRGWLAVTNLQNCSSSSENLTYKAIKNG